MSDLDEDDISTDPSDYSDAELSSNKPNATHISTFKRENQQPMKQEIMNSNNNPFLKIIINNLYKKENIQCNDCNQNTSNINNIKQQTLITNTEQTNNGSQKNNANNSKSIKIEPIQNIKKNNVNKFEKKKPFKRPSFNRNMDIKIKTEHKSQNNDMNTSFERHALQKESLDSLLAKAMTLRPNLRWNVNNKWCRYCGARASSSFHDSPWGYKKLCLKHYKLWKQNRLNLSTVDEPKNIESVMNHNECTERTYLINILMKYQDLNPCNNNFNGFTPRNLRHKNNIKKPNLLKYALYTSSDAESSQSSQEQDSDYDCVLNEDMDEYYEKYTKVTHKRKRTYDSDSAQEDNTWMEYMQQVKRKRKKIKQTSSYTCDDCDKVFVSPKEFRLHAEDMHDNKTPFLCHICDGKYACKGNLTTHIRRVHDKEVNYKCRLCNREFFNQYQCRKHCQSHSDVIQNNRPKIKKIKLEKIKPKPIKQKLKSKPQPRPQPQKTIQKKPGKYLCSHCVRTFTTKFNRKRHILNMHTSNENKPFQCQYCTYGAATKWQIDVHENIHRNEQKYKCTFCDKRFNNKQHLNNHMSNNHIKPFKCMHCKQAFGLKKYLQNHIISKHTKNENKPYQCRFCGYGAATQKIVNKHELIHSKSTPFACDECDKCFKLDQYLKTHMKMVHGDHDEGHSDKKSKKKKWKCDVCKKKFKEEIYFNNHLKCHSGCNDNYYECDQCEYSTRFKEKLHKHCLIHNAEKPFECYTCHKRFRLKKHRKHHMRKVHKIK